MALRYQLIILFLVSAAGCGGGQGESKKPASDDLPPVKERVAQVGVGTKGRKLEKATGAGKVVASPAVSYFRIKEKVAFEIQIPYALKLYKATNGRAPRTHDQFMREIVEANQIELPELPENAKYEYRPKDEKLWVVPK